VRTAPPPLGGREKRLFAQTNDAPVYPEQVLMAFIASYFGHDLQV
jgi:hypothetical protein